MKSINLTFIILVIFLKTGNVYSDNNLFYVNNIEIVVKPSFNNDEKAKLAIKKGFDELTKKLLLEEDSIKLKKLSYIEIRSLVSYYQVSGSTQSSEEKKSIVKYNIMFDKNKLHNLFYRLNISYSDISQYELYILPVFKKDEKIFIFNQNFFYENWNSKTENKLIEFILALENIEIIQNINFKKNNLISIRLEDIFKEYSNKNLALVLIEEKNSKIKKIFLKSNIMGNNINKSILIEDKNINQNEFYEYIITKTQKEIIHLIKSQNLIDIKTPSFINTQFYIDKKIL